MSPRRRAPAAVLSVLLLVGLASLGVRYGLWAKTLRIEGVVHTGEVEARWTRVSCAEFHPWPNGNLPGEAEGKDVGMTTAIRDPAGDQMLHITLSNVYPSYAVDCQVRLDNNGTIPVIIRGTTIVAGGNLTNCALSRHNKKTLRCHQPTVVFTDNLGVQLHPEDEAASNLTVHVEQPADQGETYAFDVMVCMAQWNEEVTAAQCFAAGP